MSRVENRDNRRRKVFALTPPLLAGLLFIAALAPGPLLAQADAGKPPLLSNRCLLVVETSRAMQRQSDAMLQIVRDMLESGLGGQLRGGDTLGVWTYNESLYAGRFPLQTWSPEAQKDITQRVLTFLKDQKYEQQASFDQALPALSRLIKDSPLITIILISSADEKTRGPRYHYPINQAYENQKWQRTQEKARMPLVTVLRGQDGQLGDFTVNTAPWLAQVPRLPEERQRVETIQAELLEAVRNAPPSTALPITRSGKTTQPEQAPAPKPPPAVVKVQPPVPAPAIVITNNPLTVKPPAPAAQPIQIAKAEAAPVVPDKPTVESSPKPAPAPKPVQETKAEVAKAPEAKPIASALPTPPTVAAPPAPTPEPKPAALELPKPAPAPESKPVTGPKAEVAKAPEAKPIVPSLPTPPTVAALPAPTPEPKPVAIELPKPAPAPESKPVTGPKAEVVKAPETKPIAAALPTPQTVAALPARTPEPKPAAPELPKPAPAPEIKPTPVPKPVTEPKVEIVKATEAASTSPRSLTLSNPPVQTATAVPAETLARNRTIWIAGLVLAGAAISLALVLLRRSRAAAGASLITQSFERKHKP